MKTLDKSKIALRKHLIQNKEKVKADLAIMREKTQLETMNQKIKSAIKTGPGVWSVEVEYYEGCACTAQTKAVIVHKETRPLLRDVVKLL